MLLLYSHYPLRNDFGDVRVLSKTAYNNLGDKDEGNYLYTTLRLISAPNGAPTSLLATTLPLLMAYPPHREVVASEKIV